MPEWIYSITKKNGANHPITLGQKQPVTILQQDVVLDCNHLQASIAMRCRIRVQSANARWSFIKGEDTSEKAKTIGQESANFKKRAVTEGGRLSHERRIVREVEFSTWSQFGHTVVTEAWAQNYKQEKRP
ncbi:MAG TPA: hypothetical protein VKA31_09675 [Mariprofundaceae bacterium]|nr:hypothetical protein [Mariprofundaceae bacterium]